MLTIQEENFLELIEIDKIEEYGIENCVDIEVEEDKSFVLTNGIISHNSAMGSILQKRDPRIDAVYSLKGKIKNARSIRDLSSNAEIIDLMNILNLEPNDGKQCSFANIALAVDADCLSEDTLIQTINGNKKLKDIIHGDLVLSHDGKYHEVINIVESEKPEYIEIKFGNDLIKCSLNHKFRIVRNNDIIDVKACDLLDTDLFIKKG